MQAYFFPVEMISAETDAGEQMTAMECADWEEKDPFFHRR